MVLIRSLGDLKYKQAENLGRDAQMITAEPDVTEILLQPDDKFIILACDGIWDCLSNQQIVRFPRHEEMMRSDDEMTV